MVHNVKDCGKKFSRGVTFGNLKIRPPRHLLLSIFDASYAK